ncbi:MAG: tRNA (adenosine(37)-N6)-threonylcarbamoyltransferase complex dimerization subunit type 1 TsaB, partial [Caulobacteraceae bacterium]
GSFTGLRVGLAFAKGLALALDIPCTGVGTLSALAAGAVGRRAAVIDAGRGAIYLQRFDGEEALGPPAILPLEDADLANAGTLIGPTASRFAASHQTAIDLVAPDITTVARLATRMPDEPPRPLYLRAPDARVKAA